MAQTAESTLEAKLRDLEASVRALRTTNPFGLVAAEDASEVELLGTANSVGGVAWVTGAPAVTLYVASGRLRVEVAAALTAAGNKCSAFMSWAVRGPADTEEAAPTAAVIIAPEYTRAIEVQHSHSGQDQRSAQSTFGTHPDLTPGWYSVGSRYALSYSGTSVAPYGSFANRRLSAMPY